LAVFLAAVSAVDAQEAIEVETPPAEGSSSAGEEQTPNARTRLVDPPAEDGPYGGFGRGEAASLLQGVFQPLLDNASGTFGDLTVKRFLGPDVAVVSSDEPSHPEGFSGTTAQAELARYLQQTGEPQSTEKAALRGDQKSIVTTVDDVNRGFISNAGARIADSSLLRSTVPLKTETPTGQSEAVDLNLERSGEKLVAASPIVDVEISDEIGDGIHLPESGISIELRGAPSSTRPSVLDDKIAFVPNVAADTDLAVAPTPTGVETFTQLRSPDSPRTQTFDIGLPESAVLQATEDGGAEVTRGDETIARIGRPFAVDASGASVPVTLEVVNSSFTLTVSPEDATYPILVDPLIHTYEWKNADYWKSGICSSSFEEKSWYSCNTNDEWSYRQVEQSINPMNIFVDNVAYSFSDPVPYGTPGIVIRTSGYLHEGELGSVRYTVPRFYTDQEEYGAMPTSYISKATFSNLDWNAWSDRNSPYLYAGIWDFGNDGWVSYFQQEGKEGHGIHDMNWVYEFPNPNHNTSAKTFLTTVYSSVGNDDSNTELYIGSASVELNDKDVPAFGSLAGPPNWVDDESPSIDFVVSDTGLGVKEIRMSQSMDPDDKGWTTKLPCHGLSGAACPRTWDSGDAEKPELSYDPEMLTDGIHYLHVAAKDPIGNKSTSAYAQVKVDHSAPEIGMSGTMTQQDTLGVKEPSYTLRVDAIDGYPEQAQSGVVETMIKIDGEVVDEVSPGCASHSCGVTREWTLDSAEYETGEHTVEVVASDAIGHTETETLPIYLQPQKPKLELSGTLTEQDTLGVFRPTYSLRVDASARAMAGEDPTFSTTPTFHSAFGSSGTGDGQLNHPAGMAIDSAGDLWVVDQDNDRVQKFNQAGEFLDSFGSSGAGDGQFGRPTSVAIDSAGDLWVTDAGNSRVQKFSPEGEFLAKFGSYGIGNGQFNRAEGIAIAPNGHIWIGDTYNGRLQEFNAAGEFIKVVGSQGSGEGQIGESTDLDFAPNGDIWVSDWRYNRVVVFNQAGEFVRQFGSAGSGDGQFNRPDAIEVDPAGNVWVGDQNNDRIQQFTQSGEYVDQFGSTGAGDGEFDFGWPMGIASDSVGNLWIADVANDRVQRWEVPSHTPSFHSAFGSSGTGDGQLNHPAGMAIDSAGDLWVVDQDNDRVQKFNQAGEFLDSFGSSGAGDGQFGRPTSVAIDSAGDLWVTDAGNSRVQKFSPEGEFLAKFGSYGIGNGQFNRAEGIAIAPNGHIWIGDTYNGRLQEFNAAGEFIKVVGSQGSGEGQIGESTDLDFAPNGDIWVSDWRYNRVVVFNQAGEFVRQFGSAGSGDGQFNRPDAIEVDPAGNVWVGDQNNDRIQQFTQSGEYVDQFGSTGAGDGEFDFGWPMGIASDSVGNLWISDVVNDRVQRWTRHFAGESTIETSISVDGDQVDTASAACLADPCSVAQEWELDAESFSMGPHAVEVEAIDGLGNSASEELPVELKPDTTKPSLTNYGGLVNAPEGWVDQKEYLFLTVAQDEGSGVTSLELLIDGEEVAGVSGDCLQGGCQKSIFQTIDTSAYSGGAHPAEIIATDGIGHTTVHQWTINVDPKGAISSDEAAETLDAVDTTSDSEIVAPVTEVLEPEQIAAGDNPGLAQNGEEVVSTGTPTTTSMTTDLHEGFTIHSPEGETTITPAISEDGAELAIAEGVTGLTANTEEEVDTAVRPQYNGTQTFQAIRSPDSPSTFSWDVELASDQHLELVDPQHAQVVYDESEVVAFLITAEPAHDATGDEVPTTLQVSGNTLTLNVDFSSGEFVFPIVAGQGWETSYETPILIEGPEDETEIEEREREEEENAAEENPNIPIPDPPESGVPLDLARRMTLPSTSGKIFVPAPAYPPGGEAGASRIRWFTLDLSRCGWAGCSTWEIQLDRARFERGDFWARWVPGTVLHCGVDVKGAWDTLGIIDADVESVNFHSPSIVVRGSGRHLNAYCNFNLEILAPGGPFSRYWSFLANVWPNGFQQSKMRERNPPVVPN
jgi:tripartite motif-containing protein 71